MPDLDFSPETIRTRLVTVDRTDPDPGGVRRASVALALRYAGEGAAPEVLLMRRIEQRGDPWSGQVSLPGGRQEPQDASALAAAVRETREEVNLDLASSGVLLGALPPQRPRIFRMQVSPFVFQLAREVHPTPGPEACRVFWLPLAEAASGRLDGTTTYKLGPLRRRFPCWNHEGEVIWGLTHRIISDLFDLLRR